MTPASHIVYEQPLNERIRNLLRVEFLLRHIDALRDGESEWENRNCCDALLDLLDILQRSDLRSELLKEIERIRSALSGLAENPQVDRKRLTEVLDELDQCRSQLQTRSLPLDRPLADNELLRALRQRHSIAAGSCSFDLPAWHFWLQRDADQRRHDVATWVDSLTPLPRSITLLLRLLRESAATSHEVAANGIYQRSLAGEESCQLLRILLPQDAPCYPDISAGRHRLTIRFMRLGIAGTERAVGHDDEVDFLLSRCTL